MNRLLLILIMLSCAEVNAQFTKGTFLFGGSIGGSYSTSTSTVYVSTIIPSGANGSAVFAAPYSADKTSTAIIISPQVGYFIKDNFSLGLRFSWTTSLIEERVLSYYSSNSQSLLSVEPFLRYYLNKFFIQGSIGIGAASNESKLEYALISNGGGSTSFNKQNLKRNANTLLASISIGRASLFLNN
jgi:hypothetical protein